MKNSITFVSDGRIGTEVLRLSREGVTANPDIPVDDAARLVLEALDDRIKIMVQKAVEAEREACAQMVDHILKEGGSTYGDAIRARGQE